MGKYCLLWLYTTWRHNPPPLLKCCSHISPADGAHPSLLNIEQHLHCFLKHMSCTLQVTAHWQRITGVSHIHKHLSDLTWCVVPSISTGTMKSALLIGYKNTMWIWLKTLVGWETVINHCLQANVIVIERITFHICIYSEMFSYTAFP